VFDDIRIYLIVVFLLRLHFKDEPTSIVLYTEIITVYCATHMKHIHTHGKNEEICVLKQMALMAIWL